MTCGKYPDIDLINFKSLWLSSQFRPQMSLGHGSSKVSEKCRTHFSSCVLTNFAIIVKSNTFIYFEKNSLKCDAFKQIKLFNYFFILFGIFLSLLREGFNNNI